MSNEELSAMISPIRLRSLDSSVALFAVLVFCAIGGVFSLFYFEIEDNQPLLTLRRRPEDPQLRYPHSGTDQTTPITKIPKEQYHPSPSPPENHAAAVPESHRPGTCEADARWAPRRMLPPPPCRGLFTAVDSTSPDRTSDGRAGAFDDRHAPRWRPGAPGSGAGRRC